MSERNARLLPAPPPDLSTSARALWPGLASDVAELNAGAAVDYLLLAELLRTQDRLDEIRAVLRDEGLTIAGSKGQTRPHPLLVTEAVYVRAVADAYRRLRLSPKERPSNWQVYVQPDGRLRARD